LPLLRCSRYFSNSTAWADCETGFEAFDSADYERALRHLLPCARAGDPIAQFEVGVMYGYGRGVPQDDAEAVRWFRPAAEYGVPEAQFNLGVAYANGWGVPQDDVLAYMWFRLAVARSPQGDEVRERAVAKRDEVAVRLSLAQRARGEELERNWQSGFAARSGGGAPAYGDPGRREPPPTQRQVGPDPFRVALERQVRETQQLLAALGYDPGPVDGVIGPRTRAAVRAFQADAGLPADGKTSDELRAALTDAVSSGRSVAARSAPTQRRLDSTGTGFAVSQNGQLITNHHVVADCAEVRHKARKLRRESSSLAIRTMISLCSRSQ
jgi:localization factor PodJL